MVRCSLCKGEKVAGACAKCGQFACPSCDRCSGCSRVICSRCDRDGPDFEFPGDLHPHPHNRPGRQWRFEVTPEPSSQRPVPSAASSVGGGAGVTLMPTVANGVGQSWLSSTATAVCPDRLRYEQLGEADGWRGRVVRAFFWLMKGWPS